MQPYTANLKCSLLKAEPNRGRISSGTSTHIIEEELYLPVIFFRNRYRPDVGTTSKGSAAVTNRKGVTSLFKTPWPLSLKTASPKIMRKIHRTARLGSAQDCFLSPNVYALWLPPAH